MNPLHPTASLRFSINTIRKSRSLIRLLALLALVSIAAIALGATSSSANVLGPLFTRAASVFGNKASVPQTRAVAVSPALHSAESAQPLRPTSAMATERRGHTATRLSDGRVLIAGGENSTGVLNQTEIYDATTDTFSAGANMNDARVDHTGTLLSDGRVLIAGGRSSAGALSTTEIFDPTSGTFASGPNMSVARAGHSATLFADGRILVAGGDAGGSAEILDAALSSSTPAGPLGTARSMHSAALLQDGSVLVVGGHDAGGNELSSGEIFNGASFSAVAGSLTVARVRPLLRVLFDGKVQIIGGSNDGSMEIYDPQIATYGAYAHVAPEGDTCVGLPAQVQASQTRAALFHNGQTDATFDRSNHSITELSSQAIVVGGVNNSNAVLGSTPVFASSGAEISTDKLDYAPGETAHISGRGFAAGETVRLKIHEDPHTPQERGLDVVANADGSFVGEYLVQDYDLQMKFFVGARGLTSGLTAQTTFTDDVTVKVVSAPSGTTFTLTKTLYGSSSCNTGAGAPITVLNVDSTTGDSTIRGNSTSIKLQAAATSNQGAAFSGWTSASGFNTIDAFTICVNGANATQTRTYTANYVANVPPVASAVSISGTPKYGSLLTGNYTYSDADGDLQGASTFRWLRDGVTTVGTSQTYTAVSADIGHTLRFEVTPVAATGTSPGTAVQSTAVTINKADANCSSITGYTGTYDAAAHGASGTCTGVDALGAATGSSLNLGATFTNVPGGTANWTFTGSTNYNDQNGSVAIVINKANANCTSITGYTGTYDAAAHGASGTCTGVDALGAATGSSLNLGATFTNVPGGTANWTFTGGTNYNDQNGSVAIVINKANANCTSIAGYTGTYDAAAHGASGTCTGVDALGAATGSSLNLGATFTNVPGGTANWTFTGGTNYNDQNGSVAIVINKANANCTSIAGYTGTYDAAAHGASGTCTGVDALGAATGSSLDLGASFTNVPGGTANWTFTGGTNYNDQNGSVAIVINKANANCTSIAGYTGTYDAAAHGASGTCTGVDALGAATGSSLDLGASFTNVPGGTANWTFTGGTNYNDQNGSVAIVINKANANCTSIAGYTGTYDAAAHGASGTCTGVDALGAATGSSLDLGASFTNVPGGTANWTFTGGTNYNDQNGSVAIVINKANANCTSIAGYTGTYDAAAHGASGTCTGVDALGAATGSSLDLGASFTNVPGGTANWTFTGGTNYNDQNGSVAIVINKANANCTSIAGYTGTYDAAAHGASGTCTGVDALGAATGSSLDLGASFTNVPGGTANWTFTGGTNYNDQNGSVAIVINKANANCTSIAGYTGTYDAAAHGASGTCTGVDALGAATGSSLDLGASFTNVPGGTANWTFTGGTNYNDQSGDAAIVISKRTLTTSIIGDPTKTYDGNTSATLISANFSIGNLVTGQTITVTKTGGTYNSKDVLAANTVSTTLTSGDFSAGPGTNLNNYYLPSSASGAGHITAKALSITADNKSFLFGSPLPTLTATFNAFAGSEGIGNLTGTLIFTLKDALNNTVPYNASTLAGTYTIVASGVSSTNYAITFGSGTLTIGSWTITGFYQPVDMNIGSMFVLNTIKGGSTVPLKFNVYAGTPGSLTERKSISDVMFGSVQVSEYACSSTPGYESPMDVTNTGSTSLRYDTTGAQFIQNWQTPKPPNKCYQVRMTTLDGSHIDAYFKTK